MADMSNKAVADLLALLERDSAGRWCFKSLSRDALKFDAVIERLIAATASPAAPKEEAPLIFKRSGSRSRCCNSFVTWSADGPICDKCKKYAVTQ